MRPPCLSAPRWRLPVVLLAFGLLAPSAALAQPKILLGGGLSSPYGDLGDVANAGVHADVGLDVGIPTLPIGIRGDGILHRLGSPSPGSGRTQILAGTLSLVYTMPGIGLEPYLLGGVGTYRIDAALAGATGSVTDTGYHGGFGVSVGSGGLVGFAEIRYVRIGVDGGTLTLVPLTFGLRL